MSPKGVEHGEDILPTVKPLLVHSSMSPKGVEHQVDLKDMQQQMCAFINVAERR